MLDTTGMPPEVTAAFARFPADAAARLRKARALILKEAERLDVAPMTETLKWGQPAYVPPRSAGTTLRLALQGGEAAIFVHCQTTLIEEARAAIGNGARFAGNRAMIVGEDLRPARHLICAALTYHRRRRDP